MDYETELKAIADAQKRQKQAELDTAKQSTLNTINTQQEQLIPTFQTQRQQENVKSQINAKNFAEYLARRGQTGQGIGAQAELSRTNTLGNALSGINTAETSAMKDFANQRTQAETGYQTNLNNAYNAINTDYMNNLYNAKQAEQERQDRLKQQAFENSMALRSYNSSSGSSSSKPQAYKNMVIPYQNGIIASAVPSGSNTVFTLGDGSTLTLQKGVNPFTGNINNDLYTLKNGVPTYDATRAFGSGYQPKYIGENAVKKTGTTTTYNGQTQNIWKTGKDTYWVWDGKQNKYVRI